MNIRPQLVNMKSIRFLTWLRRMIVMCCLLTAVTAMATSTIDKNWQFKVFLDGEEIGFHNFSISGKAPHHEIYSSARFDVKFLFVSVYSYRHDNVELWQGQCLDSINATTDDNGEIYRVSGKTARDAFIVNTTDKESEYPSCVKTFAYWDPGFLDESSLLNSQTGEMVAVNSEYIGSEQIIHLGEEVMARRYRLSGENLQIDLWYSEDDHWLALESVTESGRIVRYAMP